MRRRIWLLAAAALVAGLFGCSKPAGGPADQQPPAPTSAPATTPAATTPAGEEQIGGAEVILADGRHPVLLTKIDTGKRTITFDLTIFLTGDKAKQEWAKQHPGEEGPPNDYMLINNNAKLRTLPVVDEARLLIIDPEHYDPSTMIEVELADLKQVTSSTGGGLFWITVKAQKITRVEQQFLP
jgi:hypothetical protein